MQPGHEEAGSYQYVHQMSAASYARYEKLNGAKKGRIFNATTRTVTLTRYESKSMTIPPTLRLPSPAGVLKHHSRGVHLYQLHSLTYSGARGYIRFDFLIGRSSS